MKRSGPIRSISKKRQRLLPKRNKVREEVLERAEWQCEYAPVIPEIACGTLPNRMFLEIDELRGGSHRVTEWTDPDLCRATCPIHHDYKTDNKEEVLKRLALHEGRQDIWWML